MHLFHATGADTVVFGATTGVSGWWVVRELLARGPSWELVPPLLVSVAALIGAVRSWRADREKWADAEQERRQKAELHALEVRRLAIELDRLPSRN